MKLQLINTKIVSIYRSMIDQGPSRLGVRNNSHISKEFKILVLAALSLCVVCQ